MTVRLIFMGTPDFTLPVLDALYDAGHEIVLVVTQPDAPVGRKQVLTAPPAKQWANAHHIPVYQPHRIRDDEAIKTLSSYRADAAVVAAFGQILPKEILDMFSIGCINVHASLLPKYRGAAPIQWAIMNGDKTTGVTIMQMDVGLDDGDILLQKEIPIEPGDTGGSLFDKLAVLGGEAITEALDGLRRGSISPIPQDDSLATTVGKIDKSMGRLHFEKSAVELTRFIRALNPWPGTSVMFRGKLLKFLEAETITELEMAEASVSDSGIAMAKPGETIAVTERVWIIAAGEGYLSVSRVQPAGKKPMAVADFLRGHSVKIGECVL